MKFGLALLVACAVATVDHSASAAEAAGQRWLSAWGTAQTLVDRPPADPPPRVAGAPRPPSPPPSPIPPIPPRFADETVRMIVRPSIGGRVVRLQFANAHGADPVTFDRVRLARSAGDGRIVSASDSPVTFAGSPDVTIEPGTAILSDPVHLSFARFEKLAVSVRIGAATDTKTVHPLGLETSYVVPGDRTSAAEFTAATTNRSTFWLTGLEVAVGQEAAGGLIVAFGDSITDGYATTPGASRAWPDQLAERLATTNAGRGWSVINMGLSGNRVRREGTGSSALARFDRDVLARPGTRWVILLEGINDINLSVIPGIPASEHVTAAQLIAAYSQFIDRAHLYGIKVMGATIAPTEGLWLYGKESEALRQALNGWIRGSGRFDAVVDFDAVLRDPARPTRLLPAFDPGDHVHPNDAGNAAMARAVPIDVLLGE